MLPQSTRHDPPGAAGSPLPISSDEGEGGSPSSVSSHANASPRQSGTSVGGDSSLSQASGSASQEPANEDAPSRLDIKVGRQVELSTDSRVVEDMDKLLRKLDLEKKMIALQQRLELASMKATNGWEDMSIHEIEDHKLTPKAPARRNPNLTITVPVSPLRSSSRPHPQSPYEPPSPSRPWQLIDVLWQPLPPPSASHPTSPSSPRKRSRAEFNPIHQSDFDAARQSPLENGYRYQSLHQPGPRSATAPLRRASSSSYPQTQPPPQILPRNHYPPPQTSMSFLQQDSYSSHPRLHQAFPQSPLRHERLDGIHAYEREHEKKRRTQSHSQALRPSFTGGTGTTTQDVNAAKALTFMLGSGSPTTSEARPQSPLSSLNQPTRPGDSRPSSLLPPIGSSHSLPIPEHGNAHPARKRASSSSAATSPDRTALREQFSEAESSRLRYTPPVHLAIPYESHSLQAAHNLHSAREALGHARLQPPSSVGLLSSPDLLGDGRSASTPAARPSDHWDQKQPPGAQIEEDQSAAAELMMFLAHSPSPRTNQPTSTAPDDNNRGTSLGAAARVLFSDSDPELHGPAGPNPPGVKTGGSVGLGMGVGVSASSVTRPEPSTSTATQPSRSYPGKGYPFAHTHGHGQEVGKVGNHSNLGLAPPIMGDQLRS